MSTSTAETRALNQAADWVDATFDQAGIRLTLGGEPTYVPIKPEGPEWIVAAVGPTKLTYARKMATVLLRETMKGGACFFSPGKQYPGEVNPRWALRLLARRDGKPLFAAKSSRKPATAESAATFRTELARQLGLAPRWLPFTDPHTPPAQAWVLPLDYEDGEWQGVNWRLKRAQCTLSSAEGPAGLRLPLHLVPKDVPRRALVVELIDDTLCIFFPPVIQAGFAHLLRACGEALRSAGPFRFELQGYVPPDTASEWTVVGLTADPGVLEVNLPACLTWRDYDRWIHIVTGAAETVGLRSWKTSPGDYDSGTGGGNHLLWGGPTIDENPFFSRPAWLSAIARYWQRHPALAYLFTGSYVGSSSQAPRPDESAKHLFDLEMGYRFLESLPPGDHRALINETLRHLHTDVTGNAHRSELSLDKFWNPGWPGGMLGLLEFRAVETLPRADWMSAVALLWVSAAALNAHPTRPRSRALRDFGGSIHDEFFLPTCLWDDLSAVLEELATAGCHLPKSVFRAIWEWRFPRLLRVTTPEGNLEIRRAHEDWPLLCETPIEGGSTSRFVDTSMHRLEVSAPTAFTETYEIRFQNRPLPLRATSPEHYLAGLRYRRSCLYPCLHPGIAPHLPLTLDIVRRDDNSPVSRHVLAANATNFRKARPPSASPADKPCKPIARNARTHDLRLE